MMMVLGIVEDGSKWTIHFYQNQKKSDHENVAIKTLRSI